METLTRQNHVFVDFENIQQIDPRIIGAKSVSFILLVGAKQTKLDMDVVEQLLAHAASVRLLRLKSSGKNALDFAIAYSLGRTAASHPNDCFHIVSKDKGFDPLVEYLQSQNVPVRRHESFATLTFTSETKAPTAPPRPATSIVPPPAQLRPKTQPAPKAPTHSTPPPHPPVPLPPPRPKAVPAMSENALRLLDHFRKNTSNRPRKKKTLIAHAISFLGNKIPPAKAETLVDELTRFGHISINEKGVLSYKLG